ncbi:hypothetical protein [Algoriphagus namhaensis]
MKKFTVIWLILGLGLFGCGSDFGVKDPEMEVLPYFDLKGFVEKELQELPDSIRVVKASQINGQEEINTVMISREDLGKELALFKEADINKPSFVSAFTTEVEGRYLIHELKENEKAKLKKMRITYGEDQVLAVELEMSEESIFYTSTTSAALYFSANGFNLDHYFIETTQQIRWMDPNKLRISGALK